MIIEAEPDRIHSKSIPALIAKLLVERHQALVLFNRLVEIKPYIDVTAAQPLLQQFCQVLVDYMALGHFEVYECIADNTATAPSYRYVKRLAKELYPRIADTTQAALDFNDRYANKERCQTLATLRADLSHLGEQLATRIELEDRLMAAVKSPLPEPVQ